MWEAYRNGYAVPAINVDGVDTVAGVLKVFSEMKSPVIIQLSPIQTYSRNLSYKTLINVIKAVGEDFDTTVAIHLDHGDKVEDLELAIESGFTSVMYDGSILPFEENVENTLKVRKMSETIGLEGELGMLGAEAGGDAEVQADGCTDVNEAVEFVKRTNVDFLAVAIGNAHGIYKEAPKLRFDRLEELHNAIHIPLVLHGASGLSAKDLSTAVTKGIAKINFFTDVDNAYVAGIKDRLDEKPRAYTFDCMVAGSKAMEEKVKEIIKMCGSANKA